MNNAISLARRAAFVAGLAWLTASFGIAQSSCGTKMIQPRIDVTLMPQLTGDPTPARTSSQVWVYGRLSYTRGRIRIAGNAQIYVNGNWPFNGFGVTYDTFDETLFDVTQASLGCIVSRVFNKPGAFEGTLDVHRDGLLAGDAPLFADKYGILLPSSCTTWVPGTQAGHVGCKLNLAWMTVELVPQENLSCSALPVEWNSRFDIPLFRQQGETVVAAPQVSVNVSGRLIWSANQVQVEKFGQSVRELGRQRVHRKRNLHYFRRQPGCPGVPDCQRQCSLRAISRLRLFCQ